MATIFNLAPVCQGNLLQWPSFISTRISSPVCGCGNFSTPGVWLSLVRESGRKSQSRWRWSWGLRPVLCGGAVRSTRRFLRVEAASKRGGDGSDGGGGERGRNFDPLYAEGSRLVDCPVPWEQQPVNEYQVLLRSWMFPWAAEDMKMFAFRLAGIGVMVSAVVGWPVVALSISPAEEPWKCGVSAAGAGIFASILVVLRLYIGWSHVGNRLLSATVEYEESGWYDGEVWVKPREVLSRDRLLGVHEVNPVLSRLKATLLALGLSLTTCVAIVFALHESVTRDVPNLENSEGPEVNFGAPYSDASARKYEPDAFGSEKEFGSLQDYCGL